MRARDEHAALINSRLSKELSCALPESDPSGRLRSTLLPLGDIRNGCHSRNQHALTEEVRWKLTKPGIPQESEG